MSFDKDQINYYDYIRSEAWRKKRQSFLDSGHPKSKECVVCNASYRSGFHVHHATYKNLGDEKFEDLTVVCPLHHKEIHKAHRKRASRMMRKNGKRASLKRSTQKVINRYNGQFAKSSKKSNRTNAGAGIECWKCGSATRKWKHAKKWRPKLGKGYFLYWYECRNKDCSIRTILPKEAFVPDGGNCGRRTIV